MAIHCPNTRLGWRSVHYSVVFTLKLRIVGLGLYADGFPPASETEHFVGPYLSLCKLYSVDERPGREVFQFHCRSVR